MTQYDYPLPLVFVAGLALVLGAGEVGRALALRAPPHEGDGIATLQGAVLGLLSLIIGFSLAASLSFFDARRTAVVNEATAIGSTALLARLLPAPHDTEVVELLREYVNIRVAASQRNRTRAELDAASARSAAIQQALWKHAKTVSLQTTNMVPTGIFVQSLNEMIDDDEKRLTAAYMRVPGILLISLYGIAAVAIGLSGYGQTRRARGSRVSTLIVGVLVCWTIGLIVDIDRPTSGFITVSQQAMINTATSLAAHPD